MSTQNTVTALDQDRLTHIAKRDRTCTRCGDTIPAGSRYRQYRERALSYNEACHAGTLYPRRYMCAGCAGNV